jgi:phenylacetate-CoA ligase
VRDLPGIEKFKIVQESIDQTRVLLVAGSDFDHEVVERVRKGMAERLGSGVSINIEIVDNIPSEASGKYRYVTSKVAVK